MNVFALAVTQRDQDRLREVCERLATAVARAPYSSSAREASLELRLISDPIAVPYLERVLAASPPFRSAAIEGLGKIGTLESAEILIRVRNGRDEEQKSLATAALRAIAHTTRDARVLDRLAIEGVESK
jgi:HEAT repeat protein